MNDIPNSLAGRDLAHVLHPYTNARAHERNGPVVLARGEGVHVFDDTGREYIEAMSGLWSVALGFSEPRLVQAATRQLETLPFMHTFSGKAHEPSILLAEKLCALTGLDRVFFTNSGSEANDTVVKMAWFRNNAIGKPEKKKFIARLNGYHGVTVASASLTGLPGNHRGFDLPLPFVHHVTTPHHYRFADEGESEEAFATRLAEELEAKIIAEGPDTVAAFIGEPVIGAGGVLVPPKGYWEKVQAVCRKYDVLVVADEVICGFGRTGRMFGSQTFGIEPDIMVLSKQITSSYQPLAAVVFKDAIYQDIADGSAALGTFGHGYTASGHPVATAVGLENLAIIEERGLVEHAAAMGEVLRAGLAKWRDHPLVGEVRGVGLIASVEFVADRKTRAKFDPVGRFGQEVFRAGHEHGLIIRAIGDTIAFCPPLIITEEEVGELLRRFEATIRQVAATLR
ncbi:aspartate aminotransferase family protein [Cereibacter sp. SYSU M97828]|nr:aspartate aminotransferase family protein [Cereibacter flavus]